MTNNKNKKGKKDPENCPYCQAELYGSSTAWGFSPEGWESAKRKHEEKHV